MKKLMIAASAALCATVSFAELASANVVGYAKDQLAGNANLRAAQFNMVSAEGMDIQTIMPSIPEGEEFYSGCIQIQLCTSGMGTEATYMYLTAEDSPDGEAGWYDEVWENRIEKTFAQGEGFVAVSDYDTGFVTTAGEVISGAQVVPLAGNANLCGNNRPTELDIQDIIPGLVYDEETGALSKGEDFYSGCVQIQLCTSGMGTEATYMYLTAEDSPDGEEGWYDEVWENRIEKTFNAGEGFVAVSDYDEAFISLPAIPGIN